MSKTQYAPRSTFALACCLLLALVLAGCPGNGAKAVLGPLDAVSDVLVEAFLGGLEGRVSNLIETAENGLRTDVIEAGRQANIAIQDAKSALNDVLSERIGDLDTISRQRLEELASTTEVLLKG